MRFTIPLLRQKKRALRDPRNKFIPPLPPKPATPPPPATTELPAREYDKVRYLNELGKKLIYGNTYHVLVVGEDDFSTSARLAKDFRGTGNLWAANFWATSEHPAGSDQVKRRGAAEWIKLLKDAGASIGFSNPAHSIATDDWVRGRNPNDAESTEPLWCFDRVVFYQPRLDYRLLGCFLF
ncbi:hypothetical protein HanRHA438_Chr12g0541921 [Helianthus annuus]|nr:hypothetical protein HanOQP8_Chr12g0437921 [Helianthus annuus]KAJ0865569.1 hypothetical protein HanRHA438_Chr12g0541921 [Helianthus annuus]